MREKSKSSSTIWESRSVSPHDDLHALPPCFGVQVVVAQQRFAPAPYGGQAGAQLVGNRRDEVIFHLLGVTQLLRHIVDGGAQLADLIVIVGIQPHIKVALGDLPGGRLTSPTGAMMEFMK